MIDTDHIHKFLTVWFFKEQIMQKFKTKICSIVLIILHLLLRQTKMINISIFFLEIAQKVQYQ